MKIAHSIFYIGLSLGIVACGSSANKTEEEGHKPVSEMSQKELSEHTKKELLKNIEKHEKTLFNSADKVLDAKAAELVRYYEMYAKGYSDDAITPEYLFRGADISTGLGNYEKSIELYKIIEKKYKSYLKRPESLYLMGFVYADHLDKKGLAKEYYEKVIDEYPTHIFAAEAESAIKTLYMTDEEIVKMFQEKNKKEEAK